jgi:LAO/AO transport system kinase
LRNIEEYIQGLKNHHTSSLARCITIVENELAGAHEILESLSLNNNTPVIGITGPPGAGKSSLVNALLDYIFKNFPESRIGIVAIDPTSPFNKGSILGDRVRMGAHFNNPNVFIRSLASRGSLGGLSAKTIEITDVMKASGFDYIFVETVGVGQSEIEIVGLADITAVVLVPEAGDEIQAIKSGIMEIADVFVINKSDRSGVNTFIKGIADMLNNSHKPHRPEIVKTIATKDEGIAELFDCIRKLKESIATNPMRSYLLAEKVYSLIQNHRMKNISKQELEEIIRANMHSADFNIYKLAQQFN